MEGFSYSGEKEEAIRQGFVQLRTVRASGSYCYTTKKKRNATLGATSNLDDRQFWHPYLQSAICNLKSQICLRFHLRQRRSS